MARSFLLFRSGVVALVLLALSTAVPSEDARALPSNPIVFVTQPPFPTDFGTVNATFGNHLAAMSAVPRGGDLYIHYADGTLKSLTASAGFGSAGMQGANAIAVRDPSVHWSGTKVVFSMVIGAPTQRYQVQEYRWQLYEVTGIAQNQTPVITKIPNQPSQFNNVSPIYGTDDRILFISDRPRDGAAHLYPQRDEYESFPTNTGLWSLDPSSGDLKHLDHAPSGDFNPILDSFGRVLMTRWDHLQRDQQNRCSNAGFAAFNYSSEREDAMPLDTDLEVYPEPRGACEDDPNDKLDLHSFNHFLPWQINEDGTEMETLNHVGRHELVSYIPKSFQGDPNIFEYYGQYSRFNQNSIQNLFQIREDPASPGSYVGINAPEFGTHASGQIVRINGAPSVRADQMQVTYVTHHDTATEDDTPSVNHIGLSRDPAPLSDGTLLASHTTSTRADANVGTSTAPASRYSYRLTTFGLSGGYYQPVTTLTSGIQKSISYWSPDELVSYSNVTMWELQAQEVVARSRPAKRAPNLSAIERQVFSSVGVTVEELSAYLRANSLALVVSRNLTTRDALDRQQPTNLRVAGTTTQTVPGAGKIYDIAHLQFFQGDQVRGYAGGSSTHGRRIIAAPMHGVSVNIPDGDGPAGSVKIAADGSMAAFVPATRPLTYQTTGTDGSGVVRERFWLTFQPGEIRVCGSCHGVNHQDQAGHAEPTNEPQALRLLLEHWKASPHPNNPDDGGSGGGATFDLTVPATVKSGKRAILAAAGNSAAKGSAISIRLNAGGRQCGVVRKGTLDADASFRAQFKAPLVTKRSKLTFTLIAGGATRDTAVTTLVPAKGAGRAIAPGQLCSVVKKLLRRR